MINLQNVDIESLYLGNDNLESVYLGEDLYWSKSGTDIEVNNTSGNVLNITTKFNVLSGSTLYFYLNNNLIDSYTNETTISAFNVTYDLPIGISKIKLLSTGRFTINGSFLDGNNQYITKLKFNDKNLYFFYNRNFYNSGITELRFNHGSFDTYSFANCPNLKSIYLGKNVGTLDSSSFGENVNLENIYIDTIDLGSSGWTNTGGPFIASTSNSYCTLTIGSNVETAPRWLFFGYSDKESYINEVIFKNGKLTSLNDMCQKAVKLQKVVFSDTLTSIDYSFPGCTSLTDVTIPSNITFIGHQTFRGCTSLTTLKLLSTIPPTLNNIDAISEATTRIEVPASAVNTYKSAENWSNFENIIIGV